METSENLPDQSLRESIALPGGSLAKTCPTPESASESWALDRVSGKTLLAWLECYDLRPSWLRTWPPFAVQGLPWSFKISGRSALMRSGIVFRLPPLVRLMRGTEFSSWPTLRAERGSYQRDQGRKGKERLTLLGMVKLAPTPTTVTASGGTAMCKWGGAASRNRLKDFFLDEEINGALNPNWLEWYMGFPIGWTDVAPSETPLSPRLPSGSASES